MKRFYYMIMITLLAGILTGCGNNYTLTEEENELIAQYAANQVLQNNPDYADPLATTADLMATTEAPSDSTQDSKDSAATTSETTEATTESAEYVTDVSALFGKLNLKVTYAGYTMEKSYHDSNNSSLAVEPMNGGKLLVVNLKLTNTSKETISIDMLKYNYQYSLNTDNDVLEPMLTILDNDITVYQKKLKAGASKKAVVLFEIPKQSKEPLDYTLDITDGTLTNTIAIQ